MTADCQNESFVIGILVDTSFACFTTKFQLISFFLKMPFISNDEKFHWIETDEPYKERDYFVVRKLYVELNPANTVSRKWSSASHDAAFFRRIVVRHFPLQAIASDEIEKIFRKYGPLEHVELRYHHERHYAYITFRSDKDACLATHVEKVISNDIFSYIGPANTWKQPSAIQSSANDASMDGDPASMLLLNDHCLLKVVECCDLPTQAHLWKVCKRTRSLIEEFVLPKVKSYEINWLRRGPQKRLKCVREELQCIGPHIKKLSLSDAPNARKCPLNLERYLQLCGKYVGAALKELEFKRLSLDIFSGRKLESIQPLLLEIESLSIFLRDELEFRKPIDIQLPKLKELTLEAEISVEMMVIHLLSHTFPHLERANLRLCVDSDIETFLHNHGQLKYLLIDHPFEIHYLINAIANESKNLEELVIYSAELDDYAENVLWPLQGNEKLTKLVLNCYSSNKSKTYLSTVFSHLKTLEHLRTLAVTTNLYANLPSMDPDVFVDLGHEIPYLQHFCSFCAWNRPTIIRFIKQARYLRTFCTKWYGSELEITLDLIKAVADTRKSIFGNGPDQIVVLELVIMSYPHHHRLNFTENVRNPFSN